MNHYHTLEEKWHVNHHALFMQDTHVQQKMLIAPGTKLLDRLSSKQGCLQQLTAAPAMHKCTLQVMPISCPSVACNERAPVQIAPPLACACSITANPDQNIKHYPPGTLATWRLLLSCGSIWPCSLLASTPTWIGAGTLFSRLWAHARSDTRPLP